MRVPQMAGEIERRLLVNYRVEPDRVADLLPADLQLQLVDGFAVAGICLIRLGSLRPRGLPAAVGLRTENAAHRIAVQWVESGEIVKGVYIPRRDSDSRLTQLLGGRVFPGSHHHARFTVREEQDDLRVAFRSSDGTAEVDVHVSVTPALDQSDLFVNVAQASRFFEQGAVGLSPGRDPRLLERVRLSTDAWSVESCRVISSRSSFFDDAKRFPNGTATLDSALVMRKVPVLWDALADVAATSA